MQILKNKAFNKWAKKENLDDRLLLKMVQEMEQGLYEGNLGGGIYKKRMPIAGRGKRGGGRAIVAFKLSRITIFIYGFSKKQKDDLTDEEKEVLQDLAKVYFSYSESELSKAINAGKLIEVCYE